MYELSQLGHAIREARLELGLTQQHLADKAGVGINFVYQLEKDKPSVQLDSVLKVMTALGLSLQVVKAVQTPRSSVALTHRPDPWL